MIQDRELMGNYFIGHDDKVFKWEITHTSLLDNGVSVDEIIKKPIPITEEWLFKFGFEQNGILQLIFDEYSKGFITLGKVVSGEELYQLTYDGKCFLTFLQYVHQLQNLYFALTQKEIDK